MIDSPDAKRTYQFDRLRALSNGIIDSASATFLLLIAVQAFHADALSKSLIVMGSNIGLLLTLWLVPFAARSRATSMQLASILLGAGSLGFAAAALVPALPMLVAGSILAMACANLIIPLLTLTYQRNYPPRARGQFVSRTLVIRVATAALAGELGGRLLNADIGLFRWMLLVFALAMAGGALAVRQIPSEPLQTTAAAGGVRHSPFHAMRFIKTDRTLRFTLAAWMLMGFANLMMLPLRVEFLASPRYGIQLEPQQIALYTIVAPSLVRILLTPVWGRLFDRMNFFAMRILLNIGFALGTAAFFVGTSSAGLMFGAIVFGASAAGGELAWSLWVTKISPPENVAEYMSVHTFFTGVRGMLAPLIAFQLVATVPIAVMGFACAIMIVLASLILIPEWRASRSARAVAP